MVRGLCDREIVGSNLSKIETQQVSDDLLGFYDPQNRFIGL